MPLPPIASPVVCEVSLAEYDEILAQAITRLETDSEGFRAAASEAMEKLPCLRAVLSPEQAADLHFVLGLLMVEDRDLEAARRAFCSAFGASSQLPVPRALEVQQDFTRHRIAIAEGRDCAETARGGQPMVTPAGAQVFIDGTRRGERPADRPYIVQVAWDSDGAVRFSGYVSVESYELDLRPYAPPLPPPPAARLVPRWHPAAAVGATLSAGLVAGLAMSARVSATAPWIEASERSAAAERGQALGWTALGLGGVAAGLDLWLVVRNLRDPGDEEER